MNNIYLIGMMGSGKSVTGKKLAEILNLPFLDLDAELVKRTGDSIASIFEKQGEASFRDRETEILMEISGSGACVVATGGGVILRPGNVRRMRETGRVVYLKTSPEDLWKRLQGKKDRPLLKGRNPEAELRKIFSEREPLYEKTAHFSVVTDGGTSESVARKVAACLEAGR